MMYEGKRQNAGHHLGAVSRANHSFPSDRPSPLSQPAFRHHVPVEGSASPHTRFAEICNDRDYSAGWEVNH
ncbi:uncharacterized protein BKA78DRAFT_38936 [Phyllosticta capitalensis]|uniref:uncharacterized protein n=1 Tax=Phyllosticta capitalensis TaxID=121624 RepID=UPI00313165F0